MGFLERADKKDQDTLEWTNEVAKGKGTDGWFDAATVGSTAAWWFGTSAALWLAKKVVGETLAYILLGVVLIVGLVVGVIRSKRDRQRWLDARDKRES